MMKEREKKIEETEERVMTEKKGRRRERKKAWMKGKKEYMAGRMDRLKVTPPTYSRFQSPLERQGSSSVEANAVKTSSPSLSLLAAISPDGIGRRKSVHQLQRPTR